MDQFLLFQTMRGAIDIAPGDIIRGLGHLGDSEVSALSEDEIETLKRRGYLTELSPQQEQEQARTILRVLSEKLQSPVELTFHLQTDGGRQSSQDDSAAASLIDRLFSLADRIADEQGRMVTNVEIPFGHINAQLMTRILDQAQAHNSMVLPQLTFAGFEALTPWLKSENFRHALLVSDRENLSLAVEDAANKIISFFDQQVHPSWKCNISGMSSRQLETILLIFERVRQKYASFTLCLIGETIDETASDNWVTINETSLPFISPENEIVLSTLFSFVLMPNRINYQPFFAPGSHKLTCVLESKQVTYESPTGEKIVGEFDQVEASFEESITPPAVDNAAAEALIQQRVSCKYALLCRCNPDTSECSPGISLKCTEVFEQRLRQVLPLLLFNLKKNKPRAVAGGYNA